MTKAAVEALSAQERNYLGDEAEALFTIYCEFPDQNWSCYGAWGGWSGSPNEPRLPDTRREWDISYYCQYDPLLGKGRRYDHSPPDAYKAVPFYFEKAVDSLKQGRLEDGARFLGVMAHYIEDCATFPHMQAIHRRMGECDLSQIGIPDYQPQMLGSSLMEAKRAIVRRVQEVVRRTETIGGVIRKAIRDGDKQKLRPLFLECANEGARATADAIKTALSFRGSKKLAGKRNAAGVNLVLNPSFEQEADHETPQGWVIGWNNPNDRLGVAMWEGKINRNTRVAHSGKRAVKLMWTPGEGLEWRQCWRAAIRVRTGERYRCSAWVRTEDATGETYVAVNFYQGNYRLLETHRSSVLSGSCDWQQIVVEAIVPKGAAWARIALRSDGNQGAAWFDDVEVVRLTSAKQSSTVRRAHEDDTVMLLSFEEKGVHLRDTSSHGCLHFPIVGCSGPRLGDLHTLDGWSGMALALDGKDDFVEVPYSRVQDVLLLEREFTVMLWVYADEKRDAYLICREQQTQNDYKGFRIETGVDGQLRFFVSFNGSAYPFVRAPYVVGQWMHIAATVNRSGLQRFYVNGKLIDQTKRKGSLCPAADSDLYLGSDHGIARFFKGRIDQVQVVRRALDGVEVAGSCRRSGFL